MKNRFFLQKHKGVLIPYSDNDLELIHKLGNDTVIHCEVWQERNVKFHNKFFALVKLAFDNQDYYKVYDNFRAELLIACDIVDVYQTASGEIRRNPKSLKFAKMDNLEFETVYNSVLDYLLGSYLQGLDEETINKEIEENFKQIQ